MSVYATFFFCMDEQPMGAYCDNWHGYPTNDPEERAPLAYKGSAALPEAQDERKGSLGVSGIPADVRCHRENPGQHEKDRYEPEGWEPYLRVGMQQETLGEGYDIVLDEGQVRALYEALGGWLKAREVSTRLNKGGV